MTNEDREVFIEAVYKNINYFIIKNPKYRKIWESLDKNVKEVIKIGLNEMSSLKPCMWDAWWLVNHGRFKISGGDQRSMHSIMYEYLTKYAHKKIGTNIKVKP